MEIKDVVTISCFEHFLSERNFILNAYENAIIQDLWPFIRDKQIFFLIKDPSIPSDFEWLKAHYFDSIVTLYSESYAPGILRANYEGDFWARVPVLNWKSVPNNSDPAFYNWAEEYYDIWRKFPEPFRHTEDYVTLYQDEQIEIVVFLLKLQKYKENYGTQIHHFYRNGYCEDPNNCCNILKDRQMQTYSYYSQTTRESINMLGLNGFFGIEGYYANQYQELKQKVLSRSIKS